MPRNAVELIQTFNAGRDPERLALKYRAMAANPFGFLRGSCHLFYRDYATGGVSNHWSDTPVPAVWICGDLHLENFGSYLDDSRVAYFDLNDFGESALAPATWELSRFLVSVLVAAQTLTVKPKQALALCRQFLAAYAAALMSGKASRIERETATGMVRDLLRSVRERSVSDYLDERTHSKNGKRFLRVDGKKALPIDDADRDRIDQLIASYAATQPNPKFFRLLDMARRIAGTGSLGLERYVLLVRGEDGDSPILLDLRHEPGSALAPYLPLAQPAWTSQAARAIAIQRRMQASPPAFLAALPSGERSYVLRELLPSQDRLALKDWNGKLGRLEEVMRTMAAVLAWAQLRSACQQGSASVAELIELGTGLPRLVSTLLEHAESYARQVVLDWQDFADAYPADRTA